MDKSANKLPLTLSNLLASGENGRKIIDSVCFSVNFISPIYEWLTPSHIFWNMGEYLEGGFVYLMRAADTDYFKIGKSINPDRRLKQIYPKMPFETRIVGTKGTNYMSLCEKIQHSNYSHCRANGEWFQLKGEDLEGVMKYFSTDVEDRLEARLSGFISIDTPDSTWDWQRENFDVSGESFYWLACEIVRTWAITTEAVANADHLNSIEGYQLGGAK